MSTSINPKIAVIWDFDWTLVSLDSTSEVVGTLLQGSGKTEKDFWNDIHTLRGDIGKAKDTNWEHILAMDAPIWMYTLAKLANSRGIPLDKQFFKKFLADRPLPFYKDALSLLKNIKSLAQKARFKKLNIEIHHFVVSAGLKELIEQVFPDQLITWVFGCRYSVVRENHQIENVPVFCVDETGKTRSIFEISKGTFTNKNAPVNKKVPKEDLWVPFENIIYIGDGDTDIPSLSLVRSKGGKGVVLLNPNKSDEENKEKLQKLSLNKRADLVSKANFSENGELFKFLKANCFQILRRYEAENMA